MSLNYSFAGQKVLITGGGRGIGYEITRAFYNDGAIVYVIGKNKSVLEELKAKMPKVTTICQDLLDWDETRKAVEEQGSLDHLVNNAGVAFSSLLLDASEKDFDTTFGVNVKGLANCSIAFANSAKRAISNGDNRERTIVNISSGADRLAIPGMSFYSGSKAAVTMLTKCMAVEFSSFNIRVNAVCPGAVDTDLRRSIKPETTPGVASILSRILVPEPVQGYDVSCGVLYLSSPLSRKTTGESLCVDGGLSIH